MKVLEVVEEHSIDLLVHRGRQVVLVVREELLVAVVPGEDGLRVRFDLAGQLDLVVVVGVNCLSCRLHNWYVCKIFKQIKIKQSEMEPPRLKKYLHIYIELEGSM